MFALVIITTQHKLFINKSFKYLPNLKRKEKSTQLCLQKINPDLMFASDKYKPSLCNHNRIIFYEQIKSNDDFYKSSKL